MLSPPIFLILASVLLVSSYVVFGIIVRRDYLRKGRISSISSFLEAAVFFLWGGFTWIDLPGDWPSPLVGPFLKALAVILIVVGLACMFSTMVAFGIRRSIGQQVDDLRVSGPYAKSRNPQVLFSGLAVIGYAMFWPSWHTAGWVLLYSALVHMMVLTEEEHLRDRHKEKYEQYCEQVPRYLQIPRGLRGATL